MNAATAGAAVISRRRAIVRKVMTGLGILVLANYATTLYLNIRYPNPRWHWEKVNTEKIHFPANFLWGASTSAYQTEGGLTKNNWYLWERTPQENGRDRIMRGERAGLAANHYKMYREDVRLMRDFGLNAYRFSIEWSRVEPDEGKFDAEAIAHYRSLIRELKASGIEPMITLHHFTDPLWFTAKGAFEKEENMRYWHRYALRMFAEYQDEVRYWSTFNEFNLYPMSGYLEGGFPPGKTDFRLTCAVTQNMLQAHVRTFENFKKYSHTGRHQIGAIVAVLEARPYNRWFVMDWIAAYYEERVWMGAMLEFFQTGHYHLALPFRGDFSFTDKDGVRAMDFFGINYYTRTAAIFNPFQTPYFNRLQMPGFPKSDMGWAIYPEGLYFAVQKIAHIGVPMIITENGLADATDALRGDFIRRHLYALSEALREGYDVRGYYFWSLLDNFEWLEGFDKRFGLFRVDYDTYKRTLNRGSLEYQKVIRRFSRR